MTIREAVLCFGGIMCLCCIEACTLQREDSGEEKDALKIAAIAGL